MKYTRRILLICALLLLLAQAAQAMPAASYRVDWTNRLSGSGGTASSAGYRVNLTAGQTASGTSSNPQHKVQWGYWAATGPGSVEYFTYLATIKKAP